MINASPGLEAFSYRFTVSTSGNLELPEFWGDLVRSTWGASLRDLTCVTRAPSCEGCLLARSCLYRETFDPLAPAGHPLERTQSMPAPYVIHVPARGQCKLAPGDTFEFGMTLLGQSNRHFPLVRLALERALAKGWTKQRVPLSFLKVERQYGGNWISEGSAEWDRTTGLPSATLGAASAGIRMGSLRLELVTPCRLQVDGKVLRPGQMTPRAWLMALARRIGHLAQAYGTGANEIRFSTLVEAAEASKVVSTDIRWHDWHRYSARQQRVMPMGGIVGLLALEGPLDAFLPLLEIGHRLNNGKHASFGLGAFRYAIDHRGA